MHPSIQSFLPILLALLPKPATSVPALPEARRIVFLGDSITHSGQYIAFIETVLLADTDRRYEILNLGLSSETVSGLSEEGHAGGEFPRPDLHERLDRVLAATKPDLIIACYGMNCGIYQPLDGSRFQKFKDGIQFLRDKAKAAGAGVIHVTPPTFEPGPANKTPFYNDVLGAYGRWLRDQRAKGWDVIDIHTPMQDHITEQLKANPQFMLAKDGVHPGGQGHWIIARQILAHWGVKPDYALEDFTTPTGRLHSLHELVSERLKILSASYLSAAGHKRPGVAAGLPLEKARAQAAELSERIDSLLDGDSKKAAKPFGKPKRGRTADAAFPGTRGEWHGFDKFDFKVDGKPVTVVAPKEAASGRPWVWHGEFFGHKPDPDIALLAKGFHIVYMQINDMLGSPAAVRHWNALYNVLTGTFGFNSKAALVGLSRGGLYCYNWAAANPDKVACIYGDAPVCDFKSWPGGKGKGKGDRRNWELVLKFWGFKDENEAIHAKVNPIDNLAPLAAAKVPLLHVYGDADDVVPPAENTLLLAERYRKLGGSIELIAKPGVGHHPHGLADSTPIVEFILAHALK